MVSSRGKSKGCIATFVERKTRYLWALPIPDRSCKSMKVAFERFFMAFGDCIKTITTDRGF